MNQDTIWQIIRYGLISAGGFFVGKGYISSENLTAIVGALGSLFAVGWGLYVKFNTKAVPAATAARTDVPTVSAATGTVTK